MDSTPEVESFDSENASINDNNILSGNSSSSASAASSTPSRYENQKRRDWNTFGQYLKNHRPPLALPRCSGAHVLEFLRYLDQFGKTKVHTPICPFYGHPNPPAPCTCPLRQAWGSLDALVGRLRAAYEENGGNSETNPFGARAASAVTAATISREKKKRKSKHEKKKKKKQQQQRSTVTGCYRSVKVLIFYISIKS
ncbi:hypothetical protein Vadar_004071 [Vaccinium darrowii]|uniref:Uncharacterized protein n=1 Tax=Vaccinium darrowii TaxID=229202 RepID=A0ACB7X7W3_9ERIC|nr:hypothetical protein Vadar_004071 [Vaccinium darrowii]